MIKRIACYSKAIAAGFGAFAGLFAAAGSDAAITPGEWSCIIVGVLSATLATLAAPKNADPSVPNPESESV